MKKIMRAIGILAILGMMWGTKGEAANLYVPSQYGTIAAAIDAANTGDTVWVAEGTYVGPENRNLFWSGKKITVRSENGPDNCIIDCENQGMGFYFNNGGDCGTISGFTIINGRAYSGGGISCHYNSSPSITNNIITKNSNYGIYCYNSSSNPTINYNDLWGNTPADHANCSLGEGIFHLTHNLLAKMISILNQALPA